MAATIRFTASHPQALAQELVRFIAAARFALRVCAVDTEGGCASIEILPRERAAEGHRFPVANAPHQSAPHRPRWAMPSSRGRHGGSVAPVTRLLLRDSAANDNRAPLTKVR